MDEQSKKVKKRRKIDKNSIFSIGAKLVIIVSLIVLLSLGSITALVSWLVRQDLQISAEDNNFQANRLSSAEAEDTLLKMRSDAMILIQMITSAGSGSRLARETSAFFFEQNPKIAALYFLNKELLLNNQFFVTREIETSLADSFLESNSVNLQRAALGEVLVINAAPHFSVGLLAMFYPGRTGAEMVLFTPENLSTSFSSGINQSYMINYSGDILVHSDFDIVRSGTNIADKEFIREIQESPSRNRQSLIETDFGVMPMENAGNSFTQFVDKVMNYIDISIKFLYNSLKIERIAKEKQTQDAQESRNVRQFAAYTKLNIGGCIVITSIEYSKVFEGIEATTRRNIYLTIAIMLFSIMLIWFFAKSISIPLKVLAAAARSIEGGEFNLNLSHKSRDEIGVLTTSFQKMCAALNIFGRFTNKEIAVQAMRNQIKPGGLMKHATVFFSDIREFTAKSESFTNYFGHEASDYIVHWLNNYFTKMIECVEKTHGTIDKFIGDAVMAHWGTAYTAGSPRADAFHCVKSALMMRKSLYFMNKERRKGDPANPSIRIGCGINTGMVTAGQLGSDMRMEYTVIGDAVNLASRVEALTKPLGADILITEDTWKLVGDKFITEEMPSVTVKGKEKPVRIFAVVNFIGEDKGPQTLDEVRDLLGIEAPELESVDVNEGEKKYKIGEEGKKQK